MINLEIRSKKKRILIVQIRSLYWWKQWFWITFRAYHTMNGYFFGTFWAQKNLKFKDSILWKLLKVEAAKSAFWWVKFGHYIDESNDFGSLLELITLWMGTFLALFEPKKNLKFKDYILWKLLKVEVTKALFHQISKTCAFFLRRLSQSKSALTSLRKFCVMLQKISVKTLFLVILKILPEAFQINRNTSVLVHGCMKDM